MRTRRTEVDAMRNLIVTCEGEDWIGSSFEVDTETGYTHLASASVRLSYTITRHNHLVDLWAHRLQGAPGCGTWNQLIKMNVLETPFSREPQLDEEQVTQCLLYGDTSPPSVYPAGLLSLASVIPSCWSWDIVAASFTTFTTGKECVFYQIHASVHRFLPCPKPPSVFLPGICTRLSLKSTPLKRKQTEIVEHKPSLHLPFLNPVFISLCTYHLESAQKAHVFCGCKGSPFPSSGHYQIFGHMGQLHHHRHLGTSHRWCHLSSTVSVRLCQCFWPSPLEVHLTLWMFLPALNRA